MNSKTTKIIILLLFLTTLVVGALAFYINKKINPEALKSQTTEYVKKNYPNLGLEIGNLSVGLGLTTDVLMSEITLSNLGQEHPSKLLTFKKAKIKIPLLNILTGGGTIKVYFDDPKISLIQGKKKSNWDEGLTKPIKKVEASAEGSGEKKADLPKFLATSQINAQLNNLLVDIEEGEKKNKFSFDSLQLNDIGVKRPMAFKLSSKVIIQNSKNVEFGLNSIGELNLRALVEDKVLQAKVLSRINDLKLENKKLLDEEIVSDAKINIRKDKSGTIELELNAEEFIKSKFKILMLNKKIKINLEDFKVSLGNLLKSAEVNIDGLGVSGSWLDIKGTFESESDGKLKPNLVIDTTKPLSYEIKDELISIERVKLSLIDDEMSLTSSIKAFKGRVEFSAGNTIDINEPIDLKKLDIFEASLIVNGIEISKDLLSKNEERKEVKEKPTDPIAVPFKLSFEAKNVLFLNEVIAATGQIHAVKDLLALKKLTLKHGDGEVVLDSTTKNLSKIPSHSFNAEIKNLNLRLVNSLLKSETPHVTGMLNASVVGKGKSKEKGFEYDLFLKGNTKKGELKNYDLSSMVNGYVQKVNGFPYFKKKPLKEVSLPQNYEMITFDIHAKTDKTLIKKSKFVGVDKKLEIRGQGKLSPAGDSELFLNIFDRKMRYLKFLREVDMKQFPVRLEGKGYELNPDYDYTLKFVKKKAEKRIKKKVKKAAKKAVKKELKKLEEKVLKGKKAKDLLKDLFQ